MHRILVDEISEKMILTDIRHLKVMRLGGGDTVVVFNGRGAEGLATIALLGGGRAELTLNETIQVSRGSEYPQEVTLAIALLKSDKLSDVVRAVTELGVNRIQLLRTEYSEANAIGSQKLDRLRRVANEAARQSERLIIPEIKEPCALRDLQVTGTLVMAHPGSEQKLHEVIHWSAPLTFMCGPEGGFSPKEVAWAEEKNAQLVTLGKRILRAETAPIALFGALSALN